MMSIPHDHKLNPRVSCDCVVFGFDDNTLKVLLIERENNGTSISKPALPGDLIFEDESLDEAAQRVLKELTGLGEIFLEQLGAFGDPNRLKKEEDQAWLKKVRQSPEERVITIAYFALVNISNYSPQPSSFAKSASWVSIDKVPELAFDHSQIFLAAVKQLQTKIKIKPIGFNLLPQKFTLFQLHKLYEAILGKELDKRNFRRKILKLHLVEPLNEKQTGVSHKPSRFFTFNTEKYQQLAEEGYDNFGF